MATAREIFNLLRSRASLMSLFDIQVLLDNVGSPNAGQGALVFENSQTISSSGSGNGTLVDWGTIQTKYDDLSFIDAANDRFVIPDITPAIQRVQLFFQCGWEGSNTSTLLQARIAKNGAVWNAGPTPAGVGAIQVPGNSVNNDSPTNIVTAPIPVVAGDVFTYFIRQNFGANLSATDITMGIWVIR